MAYTDTPQTSTGNSIVIGNRAEVLPGAPLAEYNSVGGLAFSARLKNEASTELIAIVCNTNIVPRTDTVTALRGIDHPSVLKLIDSGVILWPHDDVRHYAFAIQRPTAPRMMSDINQAITVLSEDAINHHFVHPMIGALSEFASTGIVHGAVRPTNIFWRIGGSTPPQLGECLSAPAGYGQPVLFEPIERAMSLPQGRGTGNIIDDCYALGITIALLVLGQNPLHGLDDNAIIQTKIERGSFNAMIGNRRIPSSHIELLRGLLSDDSAQRWNVADLEQWIHGRRLTPKNSDVGRRAGRHIHFANHDYWQVRPLAAALAANVPAAVQLIEEGTLDKWMRRALGDEEHAIDLEEARVSLKENPKLTNYEDQLIARACIALDPQGPIRYRGLSVMPTGVGGLLIESLMRGENIQALSEIISSQLVTFWVEMQKENKTELVPLAQQYERARTVLEKNGLGNGVERAIYELNPGLLCLSPIVRSQYVMNGKALLPALERVAASGGRPHEPMDRHIAAFLIVRERRSEILFSNIASSDAARRGIALLTLYSEMQNKYGPDTLPALAQWLVPLVEPAVQKYLGKSLREKLHSQLRETAARGDLGSVLRLIDNPDRIEQDKQAFRAARMLYLNTMKEIAHLENTLAHRENVIIRTGKPMASMMSSYLAIIFVMLAILRAIWQYLIMG